MSPSRSYLKLSFAPIRFLLRPTSELIGRNNPMTAIVPLAGADPDGARLCELRARGSDALRRVDRDKRINAPHPQTQHSTITPLQLSGRRYAGSENRRRL